MDEKINYNKLLWVCQTYVTPNADNPSVPGKESSIPEGAWGNGYNPCGCMP